MRGEIRGRLKSNEWCRCFRLPHMRKKPHKNSVAPKKREKKNLSAEESMGNKAACVIELGKASPQFHSFQMRRAFEFISPSHHLLL